MATTPLETATKALNNPNVRRYLDLIAAAEGASQGYNTAFGGGRFESLADHPRQVHGFTETTGKRNTTTAAGRYQFLDTTWDDVARVLDRHDFGPMSQDLGAIELMRRNGSLDAVLQGDYATALAKDAKTWASLPSSPYPQPRRSQRFVDDFLLQNAQNTLLGSPASAPSAPSAPSRPEPLAPSEMQVSPGAVAPSTDAISQAFNTLAGDPPDWASKVSAVQNRRRDEADEEMMVQAIADEDQINRDKAVANFSGEVFVPRLVIPQPIEDSINRYLAMK